MHNSARIFFLLAAASLFSASPILRADVATLEGDRRMAGVVLSEDSERIELLTAGGKLTLKRSGIVRLERESEAMNLLRRAGFNLIRGQALEAEQYAGEALAMDLPGSAARDWCVENREPLLTVLKNPNRVAAENWEKLIRKLAGAPAPLEGQILVASDTPGTVTLERSEKLIGPQSRLHLYLFQSQALLR